MPCSLQDQGVRCQPSLTASRKEPRPCRPLPESVQQGRFTTSASRREHRPRRPLPESVQQRASSETASSKHDLRISLHQRRLSVSASRNDHVSINVSINVSVNVSVQGENPSVLASRKDDVSVNVSVQGENPSASASRKDHVSVNVSVNVSSVIVSVQGENPSASASKKKGCHCQPPQRNISGSSLWEGSLFFFTPSDKNVEIRPSRRTLFSIVTQETGIVCSISFQCRRYSVSSFARNAHRRTCCLGVMSPGKISSSCICPVCCLFTVLLFHTAV